MYKIHQHNAKHLHYNIFHMCLGRMSLTLYLFPIARVFHLWDYHNLIKIILIHQQWHHWYCLNLHLFMLRLIISFILITLVLFFLQWQFVLHLIFLHCLPMLQLPWLHLFWYYYKLQSTIATLLRSLEKRKYKFLLRQFTIQEFLRRKYWSLFII